MVKTHVDTLARAGSKRWALFQSVTMTSCAQSSARESLAPDFIKKAFTRGAKCSNTSTNAAWSRCAEILRMCDSHSVLPPCSVLELFSDSLRITDPRRGVNAGGISLEPEIAKS